MLEILVAPPTDRVPEQERTLGRVGQVPGPILPGFPRRSRHGGDHLPCLGPGEAAHETGLGVEESLGKQPSYLARQLSQVDTRLNHSAHGDAPGGPATVGELAGSRASSRAGSSAAQPRPQRCPASSYHHSTGTWESIPLSKDIGDHGKTDRPMGSAVHTEVGYDERVFTLGRPTCPRPIPGQVTSARTPSIPCHEAQDRGFNVDAMTIPIRESPRKWRLRVPPLLMVLASLSLLSLRVGGSSRQHTTNPRALPGQRRPAGHLPS